MSPEAVEPDPWRERGLRDAALAGDRRAWELLFDAGYAPLEAFVNWRCGGRRDWSDDALQQTWLVAVRRLSNFDPGRASFATWLRGIAANVVRELLRRHRRDLTGDVPDSASEPKSRCAERVALTLAEMPEQYEAVLRAKYLDGFTVAEIAGQNGRSEKAVESLLSRARSAFREAYESP